MNMDVRSDRPTAGELCFDIRGTDLVDVLCRTLDQVRRMGIRLNTVSATTGNDSIELWVFEPDKQLSQTLADGKAVHCVGEYFADDVIVHRPDVAEPILGVEKFKNALRTNVTDRHETIKTTFSKEVATEDVVVVALTHHATGSNVWHGFDVAGKHVTWTALTYFRFNPEGKVVEEIVERNELFMAKQLGIIDYD